MNNVELFFNAVGTVSLVLLLCFVLVRLLESLIGEAWERSGVLGAALVVTLVALPSVIMVWLDVTEITITMGW